ncbi:MAG: CPBP family intramembrane glutamic endopeptidase [Balneolaceae bacterium]|nr:CPBP family intramembrane glutamic endopeptidase [Balneolaceae bacterium]
MKTVHWFLITGLLWVWAFWFSFALGEAGIISRNLPGFFIPIGGIGLLLVACLFAYSQGAWKSLKQVFKRSLDGRHSPFYWVMALVPAAFLFISMALYGYVAEPDGLALGIPMSAAMIAGVIIAWIEETVWRGYALPQLLKLHSPFISSAILAFAWVIFHFPLYIVPNYNAWELTGWIAWVPWYILYTYFLTWLAIHTRYSVLVATVSHFSVNWVIAWYAPDFMENIAALGGSILLLGLVAYLFPKIELKQRNHYIITDNSVAD